MPPHATNAEAVGPGQSPLFQLDFFELLGKLLGGSGGDGAATVIGFLETGWSVYIAIAYVAAALFVYGYAYASLRKAQLEKVLVEGYELQERLYLKHEGQSPGDERWQQILTHLDSENPNDWKLAIIEADIMLDAAIAEKGYRGDSLGERLKSIAPVHLQTLEDAWDAHKVRNRIAHDGSDFVLTHSLARNTITQYQRVFEELGLI